MRRTPSSEAAARADWFADTLAAARRTAAAGPGCGEAPVGDHAQALLVELEQVFAAGAWLATVILAVAVIETHLRAAAATAGALFDPLANTRDLFASSGLDERFDALRQARNRLLHVTDPPALTVDMHWFEAERFEAEARGAVALVAEALYGAPGGARGARRAVALAITGRVQGVGYRAWLTEAAEAAGLSGWVCNRADGSVAALLAGPEAAVNRVTTACRRGPPEARVEEVRATPAPDPGPGPFVDRRRC
jgi:acylphosphatase